MGNNKNINIKNEDATTVFRKLGIDPATNYLMDAKRAIFKLYNLGEPELTVMAARKTLAEQRPNNAYGIKITDSEMKNLWSYSASRKIIIFRKASAGE